MLKEFAQVVLHGMEKNSLQFNQAVGLCNGKTHQDGAVVVAYPDEVQLCAGIGTLKWASTGDLFEYGDEVWMRWEKEIKRATNEKDEIKHKFLVMSILENKREILATRWLKSEVPKSKTAVSIGFINCHHCAKPLIKRTAFSCPKCQSSFFCSVACYSKEESNHLKFCQVALRVQSRCGFCTKVARKKCSECKTIYCDQECQLKDGKNHRLLCKWLKTSRDPDAAGLSEHEQQLIHNLMKFLSFSRQSWAETVRRGQ